MKSPREIAVIGGGIAGLGPAWQLALRGWKVRLFERDLVGSGATTKAAGMLAPTAEVAFDEENLLGLGRHSLALYPQWVDELREATGTDLDYRTEGTLIVAMDRDDAEALEHLYRYHQRLGLPVERLLGDEARRREPGLSPNVHYALFSPNDHQIDPIRMTAALRQAYLEAGGELHENCPVSDLLIEGDHVTALRLADSTVVTTETVLIAAGAWSRQLGGIPDGILPHIRPVRGQVIALELGAPPLIDHVIRAPDAYLAPKSDGRLLIGATMEERGFDPRQTAGGLLDLLQGAWEALPAIHDANFIDTWTGFRPITLSNQPVIGPTAVEGLYLSVGHGRNGILLAPATAYGLAELLDSGELPKILTPFSP